MSLGMCASGPAAKVVHATRAERVAAGKDARKTAALTDHRSYEPAVARDPLGLLLRQAESRLPELVPIRHGRMVASPFSFYRGAALPMAADLSTTPSSGLRVQLCGDAHLANFGAFASPERRLIFDVNDFDETLPGPFEWDVKRLAASLAVAGRANGFSDKERRTVVLAGVAGYRQAIRGFADQSVMEVWYAHLNVEDAVREVKAKMPKDRYKATEKLLAKAHGRDSLQAMGKLTESVDGDRRFISSPPLIVPIEEVYSDIDADALNRQLHRVLRRYRRTLQSDRRHLLEQFDLKKVARKVVGVGSVGTRAWALLLEAGDGLEPLFLQGKEAQASVLAEFCGRSRYANQGQRVVSGQHLMQGASDIFLGWDRVTGGDGVERDFYIRQLRDWKFSFPTEQMLPTGMALYAGLCSWTLARAHARSGDRVAIAAYLGNSTKFDEAVADFAELYADQNERDHKALATAVSTGQIAAVTDL